MANWAKIWAFTSEWEGGFDGQTKGDPLPFDNDTAVFGITPAFLVDYNGWKEANARNKTKFSAITKKQAEAIWLKTRWKWFKCASMADDLALLVFDGAVRKNNGFSDVLCEAVNMQGSYDKSVRGANLPSQSVINALNAAPSDVYLSIITAYIQKYPPHPKGTLIHESKLDKGLVGRYACLYFKRFGLTPDTFNDSSLKGSLTDAERIDYQNFVANVAGFAIDRSKLQYVPKPVPKQQPKPKQKKKFTKDLTPETDTPLSTWLLRGAMVFVGGKVFKIW